MKILGINRRRRLASIFTGYTQVILGASFVSYFFKEGGSSLRLVALLSTLGSAIIAFILEPENSGSGKGDI